MVVIIVLFIPVLGLTVYHVVIIGRGRTTNEQVTGKFFEQTNPYSSGCWRNYFNTICSSQYPSFTKYFDLDTRFPDRFVDVGVQGSFAAASNRVATFQSQDQRLVLESLPPASHSRDCEPSPPPYKVSRSNMFLNLSDSSQSSIHHYRNTRAVTPPVVSEGRRRHFDNSRRSLPPQHRLYSSSQHHVNDHTLSDPGHLKTMNYGNNFSQSNMCNIKLPLFNSATTLQQQENLKQNISSISNSVVEIPTLPPTRFVDTKNLDRSETCCLGNQTVEKLQEIANKNVVTAAFNKRCGDFNGSYDSTLCDHSHQPSAHHSPVAVIGNTCVDCQRTSASPCSSLASMEQIMSNDLSRMPGRRPLSFVKAMEMSDTLEPMCSETSYLQKVTSPFYQSRPIPQEGDHNVQEVSYEIRV